jgi:predicted phage tail protein
MKLIEVKLLGDLGRKFGRKFRFMASSPRDVMSALCNQLEGFKEHLAYAHERGVAFRLINDDSEGMDYENLTMPCNRLIIAPIVTGGGTVGRILLGVALVALSFVSFGAGAFAGFLSASAAKAAGVSAGFSIGSGILFKLGVGLVLTGIASLLTPPQKLATPSETERRDSFLFDRATELTTQGQPIPLLYGRFLAASPLVISSSITTEQVPV